MKSKHFNSVPLLSIPKNDSPAYGCIFCLSNKEEIVAKGLEQQNPQVRARAVCQVKRYSMNGRIILHNDVLLHGYILFEAPKNIVAHQLILPDDAIAILTYSDGNWILYGDDETYARWVFRYDGLIRLSKAFQIGDHIQIIDGPLKDIEGNITRIDRRNRNGQVTLTFGGREIKAWLGFELIEERSVNERSMASGED